MSTGRTISISISIPAARRGRRCWRRRGSFGTRSTTLKMPAYRQDDRIEGDPRLRADRARARCRKTSGRSRRRWRRSSRRAIPTLLTSEYRVAKRPKGRVLVDYNQNAWGRTLASVYSVRPHPRACVSTPVTWQEIDKGVRIEDFRLDNVRARFKKTGRPVQASPPQDRTGRSATLFLILVLDGGSVAVGHQHGDRQRVQHLPDEEPGSVRSPPQAAPPLR